MRATVLASTEHVSERVRAGLPHARRVADQSQRRLSLHAESHDVTRDRTDGARTHRARVIQDDQVLRAQRVLDRGLVVPDRGATPVELHHVLEAHDARLTRQRVENGAQLCCDLADAVCYADLDGLPHVREDLAASGVRDEVDRARDVLHARRQHVDDVALQRLAVIATLKRVEHTGLEQTLQQLTDLGVVHLHGTREEQSGVDVGKQLAEAEPARLLPVELEGRERLAHVLLTGCCHPR